MQEDDVAVVDGDGIINKPSTTLQQHWQSSFPATGDDEFDYNTDEDDVDVDVHNESATAQA